MGYSFVQKVRMFFCRVFGHVSLETWAYKGVVWHTCKRCKYVYTDEGVTE